ncbi:hypothetical protein ACTMTJ_38945 [Phytohabitans sp. LJ34]
MLLAVIVTAASLSDNVIGTHLLDQAKATHPTLCFWRVSFVAVV